MSRRLVILIAGLSLMALVCAGQGDLERARRIHSDAIGIDAHIDTLQRVLIEGADLGTRLPNGHVDLVRLREGGMRAPFLSLWVPQYYKGSEAIRRTLQLRDAAEQLFAAHRDQIELALSASDIERIVRAGRIAAVLTIEGGHQIAGDLAVLRVYHQLGIRVMTLTHFRNNELADASTDKPQHNGLSDLGRDAVREMNRIGMVVDVSHVSDKTFFDVLQASSRPIIASHSSCRALVNIPRNMSDEMLRALARNGGVVGINVGSGFLNEKAVGPLKAAIANMGTKEPDLAGKALDDYAREDYTRDLAAPATGPRASLDDVVRHVEHVIDVAGIDHVGIGTDFDGVSSVPTGLDDISQMPNLTAALLKRGHSEEDVRKILGGNFLRVLREAVGR